MNKKLNFQNIIQETLDLYPEYKANEHYENNDQELQFSFFFGFTNYVIEKIKKLDKPEDNQEIKEYFDLFNSIIESDDEKLSNMGVTEIIETLVQEKESKKAAEKLLREKGRGYMVEVLKHTGISE